MGHLQGENRGKEKILIPSNVAHCIWNVEGLKHVLDHEGLKFLEEFQVLVLTETFQVRSTVLPFRCYESLAEKRPLGRPIGGLLVAVKP